MNGMSRVLECGSIREMALEEEKTSIASSIKYEFKAS